MANYCQDAYLRREVFLASQAFTRDGGVTHWILVSKKVKDNERKILAGCETYRKRALVSRNGKIEEVQAHGIGSVFSEYRGKGYGARMMKELGEKLRTWQTIITPNLFSVLYSDIGKVSIHHVSQRRITTDKSTEVLLSARMASIPIKPYPHPSRCFSIDVGEARQCYTACQDRLAKPLCS
jgi:GNAT superfamily N-acetyltransferase